jgi:hypothetical protein
VIDASSISGPIDDKSKSKSGITKIPSSKPANNTKANIPKSIVPGTKVLKDPLSSAYVLEKSFGIMRTLFMSVDTDSKEIG